MGTESLSVTIIDDDETVHYIIKTMIRRQNPKASVNCYISASAFLSAYNENFTSNGILLDINMPKMDGWQLLDKLKHLDFKIPIYMFSSSSNQQDLDRMHRYDIVKGYIVKPLTTEKLTTLLSIMLEQDPQPIKP
jgi:CheY-like chemotaxis protein